ncbi:MAG: DegQ family serine endoprotease [Gammaproteobacteria bacterium]|nr:DegQ family serine endoprotease [Gammaproteobacteria bacterium]
MMPLTRERFRFSVLLLIVLSGLAAIAVQAALPQKADGKELPSLAPMVEKVTPAVVNISTEGTVQIRQNPLFNDPFFRHFFDLPQQPRERKTQSLGSGVIVDAARGLILTSNHVIANADQISVTLRDGRELNAEVVGTDPATDVAVIQVEADNLTDIETADSEGLRVGDFVVAIGNPFGLGQTVTSGIVSALARSGLSILGYEDFIQTDASINPGNSGGALVNLRGELVGINTAIFSQSGGNIGIGFAIPINLALKVMEQLVEHGEVRRGSVGVQIQDMTPQLAEAFELEEQQDGAVIVQVYEDTPAARTGLEAGDVVVEVNGKPVKGAADLRNKVGLMQVGETVSLTVLRNGSRKSYDIELTEPQTQTANGQPATRNELLQGVTLSEIDSQHPAHGKVNGVMVEKVERGTRAWNSGLRDGDIITSVNRQPVTGMRDFLQIVDQHARGHY